MFATGIGLLIYAIFSYLSEDSAAFRKVYVVIGIVGIVLMIIGKIRANSADNSKRMSHYQCYIDDPEQFQKDAEYILAKTGYEKNDVWVKKAAGRKLYSYIKIECSNNTADIYGWIITPGGEQFNLSGFVGLFYKAPVKKTIKQILSKGNFAKKTHEEKTPLKEVRETSKEQEKKLSLSEVRETVKEFFSRFSGEQCWYWDVAVGGVGTLVLNYKEGWNRKLALTCLVDHTESSVCVFISVGIVSGEQISILTKLVEEYNERTTTPGAFRASLRDFEDDDNKKKLSLVRLKNFKTFASREDLMDKISNMLIEASEEISGSSEYDPFVAATNPPDSIDGLF